MKMAIWRFSILDVNVDGFQSSILGHYMFKVGKNAPEDLGWGDP